MSFKLPPSPLRAHTPCLHICWSHPSFVPRGSVDERGTLSEITTRAGLGHSCMRRELLSCLQPAILYLGLDFADEIGVKKKGICS